MRLSMSGCVRTHLPCGTMAMHVVLWVESLHRLVDPTILQLQHLYAATSDDVSFGLPVVVPLPSLDLLYDPATGMVGGCRRPPLVISWMPQPQWAQTLTPVPGSDLDAGLAYGKLALAHAIVELIRGLRKLRVNMHNLDTDYPVMANLLEGSSHLPGLPDEPPEAFLLLCRPRLDQ
jgi:hypothetical protein